MIRVLVALACLQLTACATSPVPITASDGKQSHDELLGRWQFTLENELSTVSIGKRDGDMIVTLENPGGRPQAPEDLRMIVAWIGDHHYASLTDTEADTDQYPRKYLLARYQFLDADHVVVYGVNTDLLMDAVNRKQIAGEDLDDRHMPGVSLNASVEDLRAYVRTDGARIFSVKLLELERAPPATAATPRRP